MAKTALEQWDETAANNIDRGGINIGEGCNPSDVNNAMRELMSQVAKWLGDDTLASGTTTNLGSVPGRYVEITGTTTITGFGTIKAGTVKYLKFTGALQITHNGSSMILPGAANIATAAGDTAIFVSEGSGNWRCLSFQRAANSPPQSGVWTPDLRFGGTASGITYGVRQGSYTKIGNVVFVQFFITLTSKGVASGVATISGLPFSASALTEGALAPAYQDIATGIMMRVNTSGTQITLAKGGGFNVTEADFADTSTLRAAGSYFV